MAGNDELGRFAAPDLTPTGLAARGWDRASLRAYLATGTAPPAVASDEMLKVVNLSTSRLDGKDLDAIATYLTGDSPRPAAALARPAGAAAPSPAQDRYFAFCAGCHGRDGRDGQGVPHVAPALHGNSSLRDANPHNLIVAILDGLPEHDFPGLERMQDMPGFGEQLDDAQVAELANWLRSRYGRTEPVSAERVRALRSATSESGHR